MAILNRDDFMGRVKALVGDKTDDDTLHLLEDFTDTYTDLETRADTLGYNELKTKYDALDNEWRQKYTARFFSGEGTTPEQVMNNQIENVQDDGEVRDFADLFKEREG